MEVKKNSTTGAEVSNLIKLFNTSKHSLASDFVHFKVVPGAKHANSYKTLVDNYSTYAIYFDKGSAMMTDDVMITPGDAPMTLYLNFKMLPNDKNVVIYNHNNYFSVTMPASSKLKVTVMDVVKELEVKGTGWHNLALTVDFDKTTTIYLNRVPTDIGTLTTRAPVAKKPADLGSKANESGFTLGSLVYFPKFHDILTVNSFTNYFRCYA